MPNKRITLNCAACGKPFELYPSRVAEGRSLCSRKCVGLKHAQRKSRPQAERFWARVNKNGPVVRVDLGPCWIWKNRPNARGYGVFFIGSKTDNSRRTVGAHDVALEMQLGRPLASGMGALHKCDNRVCVRNDGEQSHLFEGTQADNIHDMLEKGRGRWQKDRSGA